MAMPTAPHVALLLPSLAGGGAERVMLNLVEGLAAQGCRIDLVLVSAVGEYLAQVPAEVRVVDLARSRALQAPGPLARYLKKSQPDVLISALGHINLAALLARRLAGTRTRVIVTEHLAVSARAEGFTDLAFRFLARKAYPQAEAIVAVSEGVADSFAAGAGLPRAAVRVILNPVLTEEYWRKMAESAAHPWFGPDEPPVILGVGRLAAQKDFPTLITAFEQLRTSVDARLLILGEGPDRQELENRIRTAGLTEHVALPGFVTNPFSFMASSALFALSSVREGLPTVLIEALAAGVPVVATDCESGPREILQGGRLGRLVPVRDPTALAEAMLATLRKPLSPATAADWEVFTPFAAASQYLQAAGLDTC